MILLLLVDPYVFLRRSSREFPAFSAWSRAHRPQHACRCVPLSPRRSTAVPTACPSRGCFVRLVGPRSPRFLRLDAHVDVQDRSFASLVLRWIRSRPIGACNAAVAPRPRAKAARATHTDVGEAPVGLTTVEGRFEGRTKGSGSDEKSQQKETRKGNVPGQKGEERRTDVLDGNGLKRGKWMGGRREVGSGRTGRRRAWSRRRTRRTIPIPQRKDGHGSCTAKSPCVSPDGPGGSWMCLCGTCSRSAREGTDLPLASHVSKSIRVHGVDRHRRVRPTSCSGRRSNVKESLTRWKCSRSDRCSSARSWCSWTMKPWQMCPFWEELHVCTPGEASPTTRACKTVT